MFLTRQKLNILVQKIISFLKSLKKLRKVFATYWTEKKINTCLLYTKNHFQMNKKMANYQIEKWSNDTYRQITEKPIKCDRYMVTRYATSLVSKKA